MKLNLPAGPGGHGTAERSGTARDHGHRPPARADRIKPFRQLTLATILGLVGFIAGAQTLAAQQSSEAQPDAANQGQQLVQKILDLTPPGNSTVSGHLLIRDKNGARTSIPIACAIVAGGSSWKSIYQADFTNRAELLWIDHAAGQANLYFQETRAAALSPEQLALIKTADDGRLPLPGRRTDDTVCGFGFLRGGSGPGFFPLARAKDSEVGDPPQPGLHGIGKHQSRPRSRQDTRGW